MRITKGEAREARPNPTIEWGLASRGCYPPSNGYKPLRKNGIDSYFLPFISLTGSFSFSREATPSVKANTIDSYFTTAPLLL